MNEWSDEEYLDKKWFWDQLFALLAPRDDSLEEMDAFVNALEDRINTCKL